ncbi:MAG TPA: RDD family protein, partial [Anseongella sp.]|nr:RDD family protein [Anseongella sp.]
MSAISVETSQNVKLEYQIASVGERILANLLDRLLFLGWFILIAILTEQLELQFNTVTVIVILVPVLLYHLACEVFFNGQSVGKHTLRIKVLKVNGMQPSLGDYLMRWIFRIVDCRIGGGSIALLCILINGRGQRLGDIAAGTAVVRTLRPTRLDDIAAPETSPGYTVR